MKVAEIKKLKGGITAPLGFKAAGFSCGVKESGRKDLALVYSEKPAQAAAVFTTNQVVAAPVLVSQKALSGHTAQAIVVVSGNANACTGKQGIKDAEEMAQLAGEALHILPSSVVVGSTGLIGAPLPMKKVKKGILTAAGDLKKEGGATAAEAIMTTDTCSKEIAVQFELEGSKVTLGGMAKGSGMIAPGLATMLAFIATDISISGGFLQQCLEKVVDKTFNAILVDGDMSTNDMVVAMANGMAGGGEVLPRSKAARSFEQALGLVCEKLARKIVKDGEGATKFIEVLVLGAKSDKEAKVAAKAVAGSNLVKTAFFGEDANWGRIVAALGASQAQVDSGKVAIYFDNAQIVKQGQGVSFNESQVKKLLKNSEILLKIDLGLGSGKAIVWTTDLSYDYVRLNAAYQT